MSEMKFGVGDKVVLTNSGKNFWQAQHRIPLEITEVKHIYIDDSFLYNCQVCDRLGVSVWMTDVDIAPYRKGREEEVECLSEKVCVFSDLTQQMLEIFKKKNADYGDSTTQTFKEFGLESYAIRLNDKLNRVKSFCKKGELEVKDEGVIDTLMDMASYCLLAVIDIKNQEKI